MKSWTLVALAPLALTACSVDLVPVSPARVASAKNAGKPVDRSPAAAGRFEKTWSFDQQGGFRYDPTRVEVSAGLARAKAAEGKFSSDKSVLETSSGRPFEVLIGFTEETGPGNQGKVRYQLSTDGSKWFWYDGKKWTAAAQGPTQANTAEEVNRTIGVFHEDAGHGRLLVKAYLVSPTGKEPVELKSFTVIGVAPKTDGWD